MCGLLVSAHADGSLEKSLSESVSQSCTVVAGDIEDIRHKTLGLLAGAFNDGSLKQSLGQLATHGLRRRMCGLLVSALTDGSLEKSLSESASQSCTVVAGDIEDTPHKALGLLAEAFHD